MYLDILTFCQIFDKYQIQIKQKAWYSICICLTICQMLVKYLKDFKKNFNEEFLTRIEITFQQN